MNRKQTVVLFLLFCGIAFLSWCFPDPVLYVFSGRLFGDSRIIAGGSLDEPSLHSYLFSMLFFGLPGTLFLASQRFITNPESGMFRWLFIALSLVFYSHTISMLTAFTYHIWRYTFVMGPTVPRLLGVLFSVASVIFITFFLLWLWGIRFPAQLLLNYRIKKKAGQAEVIKP